MKTSVVIPVLNGEDLLESAFASIVTQLAPDDELFIVDNGSTDGTADILRRLEDPRLRIMAEPIPGTSAARNRGMRAATGDFIAFLDHDDLWPPGRHRLLLDRLADPDLDAARGRLRMQFDYGFDPFYEHMDGSNALEAGLGAFLFRRSSLAAVGEFDLSLRFGEDTDFLVRYRQSGARIARLDEDTMIYRRHRTNMTHDHRGMVKGGLEVARKNILRNRARDAG